MGINRYETIGWFVVENHATVREAAYVFQLSKSRIHKILTKILPEINSVLAKEVQSVLSENKKDAHLRGGQATKRKYEHNTKKAFK